MKENGMARVTGAEVNTFDALTIWNRGVDGSYAQYLDKYAQ